MPKILLSDPREDEWRGVIDPGQRWSEWFQSYRRFIVHYASLAEEGGVEVYVVGSELVSAEEHTSRWKGLIAEVRSVFQGKLTYSANWDHYQAIGFWDDVDLVGLNGYFKTAGAAGPELSELRASWQRQRSKILNWLQRVNRPLLFTEVGWCSQEGCSVEPWNYTRQLQPSDAGLREQRRNYEAFMLSWRQCPPLAGVMWWEWAPGEGGPTDRGYSPKNKPAGALLRRWFASLRRGA